MQLLSQKEIHKQQASERRVDIEEGAKVARKVDHLREVSASEESRLTKFREESVKRLKEEVGLLDAERNSLAGEIDVAKENLKVLREPLDNEWASVKARLAEVESMENHIYEEKNKLEQKEAELQVLWKELLEAQERSVSGIEYSQRLLAEFIQKNKEADKKNAQADKKLAQVEAVFEKKMSELSRREASVAVRERQVELVKKENKKKYIELDERERFINDKYNTLERAEKYGKRK